MKLAVVADIHCTQRPEPELARLFQYVEGQADLLAICGDLTQRGQVSEAENLAALLDEHLTIPRVAVWGNHDHHSDELDAMRTILERAGLVVLDGEIFVWEGVGFAGAKGYAGGFDRFRLHPFGESSSKALAQACSDEAALLERALSQLPEQVLPIALLHYAPIKETLKGEPRELMPLLGGSILEEVLDRHGPMYAFHGHAHLGSPEGRTAGGVPVFNVAMPVLEKHLSAEHPVRIVELEPAATSLP